MSAVSKFNINPDAAHLTAVKRIFRYLKETTNLALKYEQSINVDWAGDQDDRRSTTGNMILLSGGVVSWFSKKQATVARQQQKPSMSHSVKLLKKVSG